MKLAQSICLKLFFILLLSNYCLSAHAEVDADAAKALAKQNNCFRCHGVDKDKDGPAFTKSAAKFPDGHEEAHTILKVDDPKEMNNLIAWILSL